jgi:hypothetical protein
MDDIEESTKIAERALMDCTDEYKEQSDVWRTLESKAQVVITVAGVFLAAVFAFCRDSGLGGYAKLFVAVTMIALLVALFNALQVLRLEGFDLPFNGIRTLKEAQRLLKPDRIGDREGLRYFQLVSFITEGYDDVLKQIDAVTGRKQKFLDSAYRFLRVAAVSATFSGLLELIGSNVLGI